MQDYEQSVLEQYNLDVNSTRKTRGAVLCDTKQGIFLLKEVLMSESRVPALCELYEHLREQGYDRIDSIVLNKENEYISRTEDGGTYLLKRWFSGRECDVKRATDILEAAGNLAKLHGVMRKELSGEVAMAEPLQEVYLRHDRELKKVRKFIRNQTPKGEFEYAFLKCFDQMYQWADAAEAMLQASGYEALYGKSMAEHCIVHGEYNYHNVLMQTEGTRQKEGGGSSVEATTNFDKFKRDIQVEDLYYFLRKVMEKHGWKERLGDNMLNAYSAIRPLTKEELEYVKLRLVYPEKFWKTASAYYHSNKAWISAKNVEKLKLSIRQTNEKKRFLEQVFDFRL